MGVVVAWPDEGRLAAPESLAALLDRAVKGDALAFGHLYDRTCRLVYGLALRILRREDEAEEVMVDVYAQVWRTAASFDSRRGAIEGWLSTITRSRAIDRLRSRQARPDLQPLTATGLDAAGVSYGSTEFQAAYHDRFCTAASLRVLTPGDRRLIELAFFEGYTHSELAHLLDVPLGTIKTRIRSSLLKMRRALEDQAVAVASRAGAARSSIL